MIARERLSERDPSYAFGIVNYARSLVLSVRGVLEMLRQEQFRLVIAPLVGPAALVLFMTTRTIANVVVAGLRTIAIPLMPELARYLSAEGCGQERLGYQPDMARPGRCPGARCGGSAVLHRAGVHGMDTRPGTVRRRVVCPFFSRRACCSRFAQPTISVLQSLNRVALQVAVSVVATTAALTGTFIFAPAMGVRGAAGSLLAGELIMLWMHRGRPAKDVRVTRHGVAAQTGAHHGGEPRGLVSAHRLGIATRNPRQPHCSGSDRGRHRRLGRTPCVVARQHPSDGEILGKVTRMQLDLC